MSNYVQSTNFATKDSLPSGDPLKIVKGTEINTEFANIAIAVATKADLSSPTFTGTPAAPTASAGTSTTQVATTAFVQQEITAHTVSTAQIEDSAVTTAKIANSAVTTTKIADANVTTAKIVDANITTAKIADANVTTAKIADANVTTAKIADANVTAAKLSGGQSGSAPIYGARAWVNFNGTGTVAIRASGNVSSITDGGTGDYTVNFTSAMADANYAVVGTCEYGDGGGAQDVSTNPTTAPTASAVRVFVSAGASGAVTPYDSARVYVAIFR